MDTSSLHDWRLNNTHDERAVRHRVEFGERAIEVEVNGYDAEDAVHIISALTADEDTTGEGESDG